MVGVSKMLCATRIKLLYVYFENRTKHDHSGELLREVTKCEISYVSLRNQARPLEAVKDDGVLMYMVMIIKDVAQPLRLSLINKKSAGKHLSHVLLLVRDARELTPDWMRASFRQFWSIWLLNIVIVYWRDGRMHIYRYNPFTNDFVLPVPLREGELPTLLQLFPKKLPNMHRKPLRICLFMDSVRAVYGPHGSIQGTDGSLAVYIAERLNATRIITHPVDYAHQNDSWDKCGFEIAQEYSDIAMNIRFLAPEIFEKRTEYTIVNNRDDLCVMVPKAQADSLFWNVFRSFGGWVWLSMLLSLLLANIFCRLCYAERADCISLQLFAGSLSLPLMHVPRKCSLRCFLIFWLFFGMLICSAFRCNLTSMLVYRKPLPDIDDLDALASAQRKILVRPIHYQHIAHFLNVDHPHGVKIKQLLQRVPDAVKLDYFNRNDQRFAYVDKFHIASFQVNARQHMQVGRPLFHLMDACLVPFHAVYTVPYGSPYLGFFNTLIRGSVEFGFERYWDRIMNAAFIGAGTKPYSNRHRSNNDDPVVLKLEHFHAVFCLWAMGTALALGLFLCELLAHKLRRNTKKKTSACKL
ncbi:Ir85a [Drosophila busckii]|uniref:Ir85a n=2 Tax=Drosophila busckii TaxID=30019 RepID=A0A0M3QXC8_DROBS|nr:Ir85a [Drosophila busckii]